MEILRVFNNNVILARDELGREAVLTGRGLGFQRKPGQDADTSRVVRRYVLAQNAESVGEVMAAIPLERIALIERTFRGAARDLGTTVPASTIVAVIDHVNQAMERVRAGITMDYPLRSEAAHLHPEELRLAERMVAELNQAQEVQLPDGEAVALALHLFAAAVGAPSTREAAFQSKLIGQVMDILKAAYGRDFRPDSIDAARFAVHLRYFLVRARTGEQLADGTGAAIAESLRIRYPGAYRVAIRVKELLEMRLGITVQQDETAYLTMHVARLEAGMDRTHPQADGVS
ncbi:PRD domain-containing protein [Actinomyces sp.]|uniref:PRD domain-containing protein n=1 Tax=Actinomyces sp. TaxID=29317 RepID=UPI0026DBA5FA|nr:PRD domain-containing protein [Actinomyces sp.]MDO4900331.1 PRD domain-containing protein [Actinomyces sp.]